MERKLGIDYEHGPDEEEDYFDTHGNFRKSFQSVQTNDVLAGNEELQSNSDVTSQHTNLVKNISAVSLPNTLSFKNSLILEFPSD